MSKYLAMAVVAVSAISPVGAQDAAEPPCNQIAETPLGSMVGSWTVEWQYRTAPGEFAVSEAEAEIVVDLGGCSIREDFSGTLRGIPFSSVTMFALPEVGRYARVRIDSEHGRFGQSSGYSSGDSLVFESERDLGTRVLRTRHVYEDFTESSFKVEFFMSPRDGAPWELVQSAHYQRKSESESTN